MEDWDCAFHHSPAPSLHGFLHSNQALALCFLELLDFLIELFEGLGGTEAFIEMLRVVAVLERFVDNFGVEYHQDISGRDAVVGFILLHHRHGALQGLGGDLLGGRTEQLVDLGAAGFADLFD